MFLLQAELSRREGLCEFNGTKKGFVYVVIVGAVEKWAKTEKTTFFFKVEKGPFRFDFLLLSDVAQQKWRMNVANKKG